jgi:hypothetical protein
MYARRYAETVADFLACNPIFFTILAWRQFYIPRNHPAWLRDSLINILHDHRDILGTGKTTCGDCASQRMAYLE